MHQKYIYLVSQNIDVIDLLEKNLETICFYKVLKENYIKKNSFFAFLKFDFNMKIYTFSLE